MRTLSDFIGSVFLWTIFFTPLAVLGVMVLADRAHASRIARVRTHFVPRDAADLCGKTLQLVSLRSTVGSYEIMDDGMVRATFRMTPFRFRQVAEGVSARGPWTIEERGWRLKTYTFRCRVSGIPDQVFEYVGDGVEYRSISDNASSFVFAYGVPDTRVFVDGFPIATISNVSMRMRGVVMTMIIHPGARLPHDMTPVLMICLHLKKSRDGALFFETYPT